MAQVLDTYFKSQKYHEIKSQCLKERQLFVDPEFSSEVALGDGDIIDSEPDKNPHSNSEEQYKDKTSEIVESTSSSSPVRRVKRCLPLSMRTQQTTIPNVMDPIPPDPSTPYYTPLPPKLTHLLPSLNYHLLLRIFHPHHLYPLHLALLYLDTNQLNADLIEWRRGKRPSRKPQVCS
eukprot:TRINITY_DN16974_c0_g1_i1.p1 TRINITY_DN16974_c0_g1~~TRINITY_DN16974_c0_g1_i1.p1  ORF type:complete len:177 (-),score=30.87 TRINITY_DN16974_c0_g1_i1:398-928(-)